MTLFLTKGMVDVYESDAKNKTKLTTIFPFLLSFVLFSYGFITNTIRFDCMLLEYSCLDKKKKHIDFSHIIIDAYVEKLVPL